jgi:hypothetical protein
MSVFNRPALSAPSENSGKLRIISLSLLPLSAGNRCACGRGASIRENLSIIVLILVPFQSVPTSLICRRTHGMAYNTGWPSRGVRCGGRGRMGHVAHSSRLPDGLRPVRHSLIRFDDHLARAPKFLIKRSVISRRTRGSCSLARRFTIQP